jgi:uncharacterized protein YdaL
MIDIPLVPVTSSNVAAVGYDAASKTLAVKFNSGSLYHYSDVPPELHAEAMKAKSIGSFLSQHVSRKFAFHGQPLAATHEKKGRT